MDDEIQIHSSLRLRLGRSCRLQCTLSAKEALERIATEPHDLCIVDVRMPEMDGLTFIDEARKVDPALGFVIFSGYDSEENLRRAIPLQVYDFISKPLPDRERLEKSIPAWVDRTRARRRELTVTGGSDALLRDLELVRIERDVESTAAESARETLVATASMLSTAQALLLNFSHGFEPLVRADAKLLPLLRSLQEARKQVEAACETTEHHFTSAYADREASPAIVDACARHAVTIALRLGKAEARQQTIEYHATGRDLTLSSLAGVDFLLLLVPTILQVMALCPDGTTIKVVGEAVRRLEEIVRLQQRPAYLWVNRRNATLSSPGVLLTVTGHGPALEESEAAAWLRGDAPAGMSVPSHGVIHGIQKAKGVLGVATKPVSDRLSIAIALPV